jgi:putative ATPase
MAAQIAREAVPLHLRSAVTPLMKSMGYGQGHRYVHDDPRARQELPCLPETLSGRVYFKADARDEKLG